MNITIIFISNCYHQCNTGSITFHSTMTKRIKTNGLLYTEFINVY